MEDKELLAIVEKKAQQWLTGNYDEVTKQEVGKMLASSDKTDLIEAFYKDLEFGTGGLRGIMGVGTNRMNIYTVGAATQGLSNYLKKEFGSLPEIKVVIGHDCRTTAANLPIYLPIYFLPMASKCIFLKISVLLRKHLLPSAIWAARAA